MGLWYEDHFQEDYLMIYKHRNEENAHLELSNIMNFIPYKKDQKVLDLCCGAGRHSRWFAKRGLNVTGIDLSNTLLEEAKTQSQTLGIKYIRSDMRNITFNNEFDIVVNLFTSFGYFEDDQDNERVFTRVYSSLKEGGYFLFDYLNPSFTRENLVPFSQQTIDHTAINHYRNIDNDAVVKRIVVKDNDSTRHYEERVKLYSENRISEMLENNNLKIMHLFGNYDGSKYDQNSPRLLYICKK
ncbi:class I SAM-dependent methyltransferase [Halalkalibacter alkalisediminis]|uniref:Methyltransferase domain-containing protein n=1 Tax=Halalkalibacter alkalisediminis TaxID=935616 RepID=A0ABV6NDS2_9BACI|nr:class I SAM-dependent methyltransferase [Halalkalibacter alkalisediminis]